MRINFQIRTRSAVLIEAARSVGSMKALAERLGIDASDLSALVNFRMKPRSTLRARCLEIEIVLAEILKRSVEFDDAFLPWRLKSNVIEREVDVPLPMLEPPKTPEEILLASEAATSLRSAIALLRPQEGKVIRARFGLDDDPKTLKEVGAEIGVGPERVRGIEAEGLTRLRRDTRLRHSLA